MMPAQFLARASYLATSFGRVRLATLHPSLRYALCTYKARCQSRAHTIHLHVVDKGQ